jgi:hypothetical protein
VAAPPLIRHDAGCGPLLGRAGGPPPDTPASSPRRASRAEMPPGQGVLAFPATRRIVSITGGEGPPAKPPVAGEGRATRTGSRNGAWPPPPPPTSPHHRRGPWRCIASGQACQSDRLRARILPARHSFRRRPSQPGFRDAAAAFGSPEGPTSSRTLPAPAPHAARCPPVLRAPHHTATTSALVGGGSGRPRPGEIRRQP